MSDYQKKLVTVLRKKGVVGQSINRWDAGLGSPSLITVEEVCDENGIEIYFYDGNLFALLAFTQQKCAEMGHNMNYQLNRP